MLKKIGVIFSLLCSSAILANTSNPASISITNTTGTDCILKKKVPIYGYIVNPLDIPNVLFKDQTMIFNLNSKGDHRYRKSLLLSYECGEGLNATFFTDISPFQGMLVSDGYILKREKMNLSFAENHNLSGRFSDHSAVTVSWRLTR